MKVAIRVDASATIGTGHLVRCRTLANALQARGASVQFIGRAHAGHGLDGLQEEGFTAAALPAPNKAAAAAASEDYAHWLGVSQEQDAKETIAALEGSPDWLVVDHYGLDAEWEKRLRPHTGQILAIDDLANRAHDCDALVDQNYSPTAGNRYTDLVPPDTTQLLGPTYALLRPEYAEERQKRRPHGGVMERIFVFFGGTDPDNLTGRALSALSDPVFTDVAVDVVVGPNNPHREELEAQAGARPGITLHPPRPHLADLMAAADLAIGAGGTTTWERFCVGLPALVVSIADNQRPACEALAADDLIAYLGHHDQVTAAGLREAVQALRGNPEHLRQLAEAGRRTVDGAGTQRVVDHLTRTL
ncbi:UDP-2,4-diacetamido-2,4,6-trideoxy-beta-L-altropyranose hydrolase [Thiohalospira halophila DSM 15071]|uniref:UDP-2,4-diacetamido-2,4,6-trideoxy-beta-L-altropyranose hydrolase n=1 Tax=Thiohalospira halophila DSM 15071 TaxID=1123397 RepID=A0A1I1NFE5_9GAMM|nr:UDP-2,4-diacetamido-2,4,6-trideoxy-beta-L-altropyranose hydrolase [Thiohalospira halophila]SFC96257.1 UDP-2,4-diacetamido-2,4,6-trideoxy-beta-L-altropyranose hydrolase [Thiohalospira halophila DSM 15071]